MGIKGVKVMSKIVGYARVSSRGKLENNSMEQ